MPDKKQQTAYRLRGNPSQQKAICHFEGPCEVIAGPGSGKTFVLVERILFLILEKRIPPSQILVLTFSRAAAREMRERFFQRVRELFQTGPPICRKIPFSEVTFGTFHSVFFSILRSSSLFRQTIPDSHRMHALLAVLFERHYHRPLQGEEMTDLTSLIARAKTTGTLPSSGTFQALFSDYETYLRENSLLDFEDILLQCIQLLKDNPKLLKKWQEQYRFLLVDEFQDINREQFEGIRLLAGERANLFVVGDDDQSIYGFRGSDVRFMVRFQELYPTSCLIPLSVNYRSLEPIVKCAGRIIAENTVRLPKTITAARTCNSIKGTCTFGKEVFADSGICLQQFETEKAQYHWLCQHLLALPEKEQECSAVIVRSHTQMKGLLLTMDREGIRYRLPGSFGGENRPLGPQLVRKAETFLDIVTAYYRLSFGVMENRLLRRDLFYILNHPERFLSRGSFRKESYTADSLVLLFPEGSRERESMRRLLADLSALQKLSATHSVRWLLQLLGKDPAFEEKPLREGLTAVSGKAQTPRELLSLLESMSARDLLLAAPENSSGSCRKNPEGSSSGRSASQKQEASSPENPKESGGFLGKGVAVLTMHASKGLEFDNVFLPDLNEGIFPGRRAKSREAIEEERRLFYVAMTRARNRLFLLYLSGTKANPRTPSRFLSPLGVKSIS